MEHKCKSPVILRPKAIRPDLLRKTGTQPVPHTQPTTRWIPTLSQDACFRKPGDHLHAEREELGPCRISASSLEELANINDEFFGIHEIVLAERELRLRRSSPFRCCPWSCDVSCGRIETKRFVWNVPERPSNPMARDAVFIKNGVDPFAYGLNENEKGSGPCIGLGCIEE